MPENRQTAEMRSRAIQAVREGDARRLAELIWKGLEKQAEESGFARIDSGALTSVTLDGRFDLVALAEGIVGVLRPFTKSDLPTLHPCGFCKMEPAPGFRLRIDEAGVLYHEPTT